MYRMKMPHFSIFFPCLGNLIILPFPAAGHVWIGLEKTSDTSAGCSDGACNGQGDLVWPDGTVFNEGSVFRSIDSNEPLEKFFYVQSNGDVEDSDEDDTKLVLCHMPCLPPI